MFGLFYVQCNYRFSRNNVALFYVQCNYRFSRNNVALFLLSVITGIHGIMFGSGSSASETTLHRKVKDVIKCP